MGIDNRKRVRYGIVGAGWIAQEVFMPAVEHTGNSTISAIVTGHPDKGRTLAERYDIGEVHSYEGYLAMLRSDVVDAVYIATPNEQHARFAIPALDSGVHVLLEKPLEVDVPRCLSIAEAVQHSTAKLMVAYRLHFEPATLAAIRHVRNGDLGEVRSFSSVFAQPVSPENHRAKMGFNSGPVLDMGPYPINAVRNLFGEEPTEVFAMGVRHPATGLGDFADTVAVSLRFPRGGLAQFVVSYSGNQIDQYTVLGTKGSITVSPGYMFDRALETTLMIDGKSTREMFPRTDHFGGELKYFSDCILDDREPEPNVMEGLADVRVTEAIHRSLARGSVEHLAPFSKRPPIDVEHQREELAPVEPAPLVGAQDPMHG